MPEQRYTASIVVSFEHRTYDHARAMTAIFANAIEQEAGEAQMPVSVHYSVQKDQGQSA